MYDFLKAAHDGIRWIVVLMAVIVLIKTLIGWLGNQDYTKLDRQLWLGLVINRFRRFLWPPSGPAAAPAHRAFHHPTGRSNRRFQSACARSQYKSRFGRIRHRCECREISGCVCFHRSWGQASPWAFKRQDCVVFHKGDACVIFSSSGD